MLRNLISGILEQVLLWFAYYHGVPAVGEWVILKDSGGNWFRGVVTWTRSPLVGIYVRNKQKELEFNLNYCLVWLPKDSEIRDWQFSLLSYLPRTMLHNNPHLYNQAREFLDQGFCYGLFFGVEYEVVAKASQYAVGDGELFYFLIAQRFTSVDAVELFIKEKTGKRGDEYVMASDAAEALRKSLQLEAEIDRVLV